MLVLSSFSYRRRTCAHSWGISGCHLPQIPAGLAKFGLATAISTVRPAQTDLQCEAAVALVLWAPAVCLEMTPSPRFSQVFKMCFISDRHLFIFTLDKAGQRTEACVWNRRWLDLSWSLFYWWNKFTISVPRKSSFAESDVFFQQRTALLWGSGGLDHALHLWGLDSHSDLLGSAHWCPGPPQGDVALITSINDCRRFRYSKIISKMDRHIFYLKGVSKYKQPVI